MNDTNQLGQSECMTVEDISYLHEKMDNLIESHQELVTAVTKVETRCGQCSKVLDSHQESLHGNGKNGLVTEVATLKTGRTDTLSIKGVCVLIGAIGTLAATIGAAMAALVGTHGS